MNIVVEFFVVTFKVLWAFVLAAARWLVRPKEKSVAGQVCLITGAGSGLGRLFALEFARRRALLVLWDINTQSNEETAGMVRHIYRDLEAADAAALQGNWDLRPSIVGSSPFPPPRALPRRAPKPHCHCQPGSRGREHPPPAPALSSASGICPLIKEHDHLCFRREKVRQNLVLKEVLSFRGRLWGFGSPRAKAGKGTCYYQFES